MLGLARRAEVLAATAAAVGGGRAFIAFLAWARPALLYRGTIERVNH
jgi:hypothetical protein